MKGLQAHLRLLHGLQRDTLQAIIGARYKKALGTKYPIKIEQSAIQFLQKAIEVFRACEGKAEWAHNIIDHIFNEPASELRPKLGEAGVALLVVAEVAGTSVDECEKKEVARIISDSERNQKNG